MATQFQKGLNSNFRLILGADSTRRRGWMMPLLNCMYATPYVRHSMDRTGACEDNVMSEQKWPPLNAVFHARTLVHRQHHEPTKKSWAATRMSTMSRPNTLVLKGGVEPPRPFGHTDLNRARLPIPPLEQ